MRSGLRWVIVLVALVGSSALAQEVDEEEARLHFEAGAAHVNDGAYEAALVEFERSYELSGRPELHWNLALMHERLGRLEEAIEHYETFLEEVPGSDRRVTVERRVVNLRRRVTEVEAETEANTVTDATEGERGVSSGAVVSLVATGVAIVVGATFGALALSERSELRKCKPDCGPSADDRLTRLAIVTDVSFGLALVGGALSLYFLLRGDDETVDETVRVVPALGPSSGGLVVQGTF